MPSGPRIRSNSEFGLTTDNPLTAGATTFNSTRLSLFPVVSAAHAVVTLDPRAINGEPEIVIITAHTAAATVATITRAAYGTVARSHPVGTEWVHAPIDEDVIEILTSATRPSDPYEGQFIYETDTNKLMGYGGVDWAPRDAGGMLAYAPKTVNQGGITTIVDITGLSITFPVGTGRRIKVVAEASMQSNSAGSRLDFIIADGANVIHQLRLMNINAVDRAETVHAEIVLTPSAGSQTYKVRVQDGAAAGTITLLGSSSSPAFIYAEDVGAA